MNAPTVRGAAATACAAATIVGGMKRRARLAGVAVAVATLTITLPLDRASSPTVGAATPARFVTGWIPYWESIEGGDGLAAAPQIFSEISPFLYRATGATTISINPSSGTVAVRRVLDAARALGQPVIATVVDSMGKGGMAAVLADPAARTQHVQALVDLAVDAKFDGIDIDYENFAFTDGKSTWPATQPNWVAFMNELGAALHAQGKLLTTAVPAIWNGGTAGYTVYDWKNIIGSVDRLRIMVYDWTSAGSPNAGPIAPMTWVQNVITYTKTVIPADQLRKVQLGVPTYGRRWAKVVAGTCPSGTNLASASPATDDAVKLATSHGAVPTRDVSGEMTFWYEAQYAGTLTTTTSPPGYVPPEAPTGVIAEVDSTALAPAMRVMQAGNAVSCTVRWTVFYPDTQSVVDRARAALDAGFGGIAIWALGYETDDLWPALAAL